MKNKKPAEMSNEELLKAEKTTKTLVYMFCVVMLLLFIVNIFLAFRKGFSALTVIPIALMPILMVNIDTLKEMKKEKKSRNLA